jgi:hypothetical protein
VLERPDVCETFFTETLGAVVDAGVAAVLEQLEFEAIAAAPRTHAALYSAARPGLAPAEVRGHAVAIASLLEAADTMAARGRVVRDFFAADAGPRTALLREFGRLARAFADAFADAARLPCDYDLARFFATYRALWQLAGADPDDAPARLFDGVVARWLTAFGFELIERVTRAIALDNFAVEVKPMNVSTSCLDLFGLLESNLAFVASLRPSVADVAVPIMTYLSLCGSTVRGYVEALTRLARGPSRAGRRVLTTLEKFVALNDIIAVRMKWKEFLAENCAAYGVDPNSFNDQLAVIGAGLRATIEALGRGVAFVARDEVRRALFADPDGRAAALREDAEIGELASIANPIIDTFEVDIENANATLLEAYRMKFVAQEHRGVVLGLLEGIVPFCGIKEPEKFFAIAAELLDVLERVIEWLRSKLDESDFGYVVECKEVQEEFGWIPWILTAKEMDIDALEGLRDDKEAPKMAALAEMVLRQRKLMVLKSLDVSFLPQ